MSYLVIVQQSNKCYFGDTPEEALERFETSCGMSFDNDYHMLIRVPQALSVKKWVIEEAPVVVINRKEK